MRNVQIVTLFSVTVLAACDMPPAEVLDAPRVLALRSEPAELAPGEAHTLTALTFAVDAELAWSFCQASWAPTEPPSCPTGALALGLGNPLVATLPEDGWLLAAPVDASALPAVKRVEAGTGADNPVVRAVTATSRAPEPGAPIASVAPGASLDVRAEVDGDPDRLVVSWYVTGGTLEPARTLASEPATLVAPSAASSEPLTIIAVVREKAGGTGWAEARLDVRPEVP